MSTASLCSFPMPRPLQPLNLRPVLSWSFPLQTLPKDTQYHHEEKGQTCQDMPSKGIKRSSSETFGSLKPQEDRGPTQGSLPECRRKDKRERARIIGSEDFTLPWQGEASSGICAPASTALVCQGTGTYSFTHETCLTAISDGTDISVYFLRPETSGAFSCQPKQSGVVIQPNVVCTIEWLSQDQSPLRVPPRQ